MDGVHDSDVSSMFDVAEFFVITESEVSVVYESGDILTLSMY